MGYQGVHKNPNTGEVLAQNVQVCPSCWKNFSSDDAGDRHLDRIKIPGQRCIEPSEVGLVAFKNRWGSTIYRVAKPEATSRNS